jgi:integration host factor subunit beta
MVKSQLVQKLCNMHPKVIRKDLEQIVSIIIHEMIESLSRDEAVEIRGWGRIKMGIRKARIGRNPKNSEKVQIPQKKMIKWKMSKILQYKLNNNFTEKKISANY